MLISLPYYRDYTLHFYKIKFMIYLKNLFDYELNVSYKVSKNQKNPGIIQSKSGFQIRNSGNLRPISFLNVNMFPVMNFGLK